MRNGRRRFHLVTARYLTAALMIARLALLGTSLAPLATPAAADAWPDGNPAAIWDRAPGFYQDGGIWFALIHVPTSVERVRLFGEFTNGRAEAVDLTRTPDRRFWWFRGTDASFTRPPRAGDRYAFLVGQDSGAQVRQDPAARQVIDTDLANQRGIPLDSPRSIVTVSSAFQWTDSSWAHPEWHRYVIFELHPLRFTNRSTDATGTPLTPLQQVTEELNNNGAHDYLSRLGVTAIELMPVSEFYGWMGWGYNPSYFYAIESAYGTPDQLKELVDTAHRNGIAVILDVVYNHGGDNDNILWEVAQQTYYDGRTQWGPMINFDEPIARHFFAQNAAFLAQEYHIDALRFDFTRPIHKADPNVTIPGSGGGWDFLREVRSRMKAVHPGIVMIAEELPNDDWYITRENVGNEWRGDWHGPFDSEWSDPFHDEFIKVLAGDHLNNMRAVLTYYGDTWQDAVIYTESHDEVGNEDHRVARVARGGRGWELSRVAAAGTLLGRGIPMIFMGQESGEWNQFLIGANSERLPLDAYEADTGRTKVRDWYGRMIEIRRATPTSFAWPDIAITHIHDGNGIIAFTRDNGNYLVVLNFKSTGWDSYRVGVTGNYRELANSSWPAYNTDGSAQWSRGGMQALPVDDGIPIPSYGAVVLRREG